MFLKSCMTRKMAATFSTMLLTIMAIGCVEEPPVIATQAKQNAAAVPVEAKGPFCVTVGLEDFESVVLKSDKPVMVDLWAPWCGPCHQIAPAVEEVARDYRGRAVVAKVNIDDASELMKKYQVTAIPTLLFFIRGQLVNKVTGVLSQDEIDTKLAAIVPDSGSAPERLSQTGP